MSRTNQINDKILDWVNSVLTAAIHESIAETKQELLRQKEMQFSNNGANDWDETPFPELSPATIEKKIRKGRSRPTQPLYDTGELSESLFISGEDSFSVESNSEHQYLSDRWLSEKGATHSYKDISDPELDGMIDYLVNSLSEKIDGNF